MMIWHYEYWGLNVVSELEIPEWSVFEQASGWGAPDVYISVKNTLEPSVSARQSVVTADECRYSIPDIAEYWIRGGREIVISPDPEAGWREVRLFLLGSAWGVLCYQRGLLFLHASVVRMRDRAIGFCGPSGAGKSTIAAALVAQGCTLVSDDLCRIIFSPEGGARVYASARRLRLWSDALEQFGKEPHGLERDFFRFDKYQVPLPDGIDSASVPLHALYLLEWGELQIAPLGGVTALRRLVGTATYRPDVLEPMGIVPDHWRRFAELVRRVRVYSLTRPRDWSAIGDVVQAFEHAGGG